MVWLNDGGRGAWTAIATAGATSSDATVGTIAARGQAEMTTSDTGGVGDVERGGRAADLTQEQGSRSRNPPRSTAPRG